MKMVAAETKIKKGEVPAAAPVVGAEQRIRGWLRHLWRKATTEDDWSMQGDGPAEWWDKSSGPPMTSFQRFDL